MKALVIAERTIDRIVLSRFVALAGIGVVESEPAGAAEALRKDVPLLLVIDAGDDNNHHEDILAALDRTPRPLVMVVASEAALAEMLGGHPLIDATIHKPLTTDKIVPKVRDLIDSLSSR